MAITATGPVTGGEILLTEEELAGIADLEDTPAAAGLDDDLSRAAEDEEDDDEDDEEEEGEYTAMFAALKKSDPAACGAAMDKAKLERYGRSGHGSSEAMLREITRQTPAKAREARKPLIDRDFYRLSDTGEVETPKPTHQFGCGCPACSGFRGYVLDNMGTQLSERTREDAETWLKKKYPCGGRRGGAYRRRQGTYYAGSLNEQGYRGTNPGFLDWDNALPGRLVA